MSDDSNVIDLGSSKKACSICGHEPGGHEPGCNRHPDRMRALAVQREEDYRTGKRQRPQSGTKRLRLGRQELDEVSESAAKMLYGDRSDAIKVLRKQLKSKDEKTARDAARLILAYTDGQPTQKVEQTSDNVTVVEYRTAAMMFEQFTPEAAPAADADVG